MLGGAGLNLAEAPEEDPPTVMGNVIVPRSAAGVSL